MSGITYKEFKEASRSKSINIYRDFFNFMMKKRTSIHQPIGVLMYCTADNSTRFIMGPTPRDIRNLEELSNAIFEIHKKNPIKYINYTTMGVVDYDDPKPSILSLTCDREIWEVAHAPLDMPYDNDHESPDGADHYFGINYGVEQMNFDITSDWETIGETGESHSEIAQLFMERMR